MAAPPQTQRGSVGRNLAVTGLVLPLLLGSLLPAADPLFTDVEVFRAGQDGYHSYRIPALIQTRKGTLLAFCEGRKNNRSDTGNIDLLLRRSFDNGKTWGPVQLVADHGEDTIGNPVPVVDRRTGVVWLPLTGNPGAVKQEMILDSQPGATRTVWISSSRDDGATWEKPREITAQVKRPDWTWYATGPGNGIQLRSGRLVIPCDHYRAGTRARHSHVIYSDDRGATWKTGGVAEEKTNESAVVELSDGALLFNMRSYHGRNRRAIAHSRDGGVNWSALTLDEALIEPVCQASLVRHTRGRKPPLLFSNAADAKARVRMTVRISYDDGKTWPVAKVFHEGPAAYSSLAALRDGSVGLLYERGNANAYESITFARFNLEWLTRPPRS